MFGMYSGSNGSVIPLFKQQMEQEVLTVTHPDIIRYFMTIPRLFHLCSKRKRRRDFRTIWESRLRLQTLQRIRIPLSGYTLGVDMEIEYAALCPGVKIV